MHVSLFVLLVYERYINIEHDPHDKYSMANSHPIKIEKSKQYRYNNNNPMHQLPRLSKHDMNELGVIKDTLSEIRNEKRDKVMINIYINKILLKI